MTDESFKTWLLQQIGSESYRKVAERAGVSPARLSQVLSGESPGFEFCVGIADAFGWAHCDVLALAGLIRPKQKVDAETAELVAWFNRITASERRTVISMVRGIVQDRELRYQRPDLWPDESLGTSGHILHDRRQK